MREFTCLILSRIGYLRSIVWERAAGAGSAGETEVGDGCRKGSPYPNGTRRALTTLSRPADRFTAIRDQALAYEGCTLKEFPKSSVNGMLTGIFSSLLCPLDPAIFSYRRPS